MGERESSIRVITARLRTVLQFFASQGLTLLGNLIFGLLCVRLLPTAEYAKFVVLFGALGSLVNLMDVNFSTSLIPLIGNRLDDRKLIADYVASLRHISYYLFAAMGLLAIIAYPLLVKNRGWNWQIISAMVALLLVASWFTRISAAYGTVMVLLRDRASWYRGQMISSLGSLVLLGILWAFGLLTGLRAIMLNVSGMIFTGIYYFYSAQRLLGMPGTASKEKRRAIVRLALPNVPYAVFYALQGQVALFLIIIFGHTKGVASVGALGRLSQIFALFIQMNPLLIEPYFAKLSKERFPRNYAVAIFIAIAGCLGLTLVTSRFTGLFLWVLGPQYQGLHKEVVLVIAASAIACVSDLLWTIHAARRFVYWMNNILNIVLILLVQILFISKADLSTVRAVLWLSLATNSATLCVNALTGVYGFLRGPRQVEEPARAFSDAEMAAEVSLERMELPSLVTHQGDILLPAEVGKRSKRFRK